MEEAERDGLKGQLRAMAAGLGAGIDLDTPQRWAIQGVVDPVSFFRHLDRLIPFGSILYFEGCGIHPELSRFYAANQAPDAVSVARDTIFPIPDTFHVLMASAVLEALIGLLGQYPLEACFNHVKAYRDGRLLFTFHDAFDGSDLLVSGLVSENRIHSFCSAIGASHSYEPNANNRDPELLLRLLQSLENPEKLRLNWPWWKKALLFWKR